MTGLAGEIETAEAVALAAAKLQAGAVIAYPTEGVWGLGCDPGNATAVNRLLKIKNRDPNKGLIVVADSASRLAPFIRDLPSDQDLASSGRPITWLIEHGGLAPQWLSGGRSTLAVRLTSHAIICALCEQANMPLVSTSANPAGQAAAETSQQVVQYFANRIDVVVPGAVGGENGTSEIRDYTSGKCIRRAGE